ncbi:MAG: ABC transporter ATP-binding protein [Anaerolineae bacterium]|nr:ABC transporter ATP-binding protein [Anaerolineae bacterium]
MPVIDVEHVSKSFYLYPDRPRSFQELVVNLFRRRGERTPSRQVLWALRDVSFRVEAGETLGIIGANGSGKSTCLKLLTRILEPTEGKITVKGRVSALLELGAGFHPELTGRENIFLHGSVLGMSRKEMKQRFDDIVAFAELERFIDIPVKFYSSGMYVRLAFATAINVSPDILLVDEVLAVGDQSFQEKCLERIHELKAEGVTIIFVSHSLDAVRNLCDRAIWLDQGILREDGVTDVVVARYLQHVYEREEEKALAAQEASRQRRERAVAQEGSEEEEKGASAEQEEQDHAEGREVQNVESESDPLARYRNRWGSRQAEIVDVYFLNEAGERRLLFATGEPMQIVIRYRAHERIEHPMFGLAIHRSDGLQINGPNNIFADFDIPFIQGEGEVRYIMESLPLLEGAYYVTAALYDTDGTHAYDHQALYYRFRVHRGQVGERYGVIYIPAKWAHFPHGAEEGEANR